MEGVVGDVRDGLDVGGLWDRMVAGVGGGWVWGLGLGWGVVGDRYVGACNWGGAVRWMSAVGGGV